jgi:predicted nucleic acid-binding protein
MVRRANLEPVAAEAFVETVTSVLESRILLFGPDVYSGRLQEAIRRIPRDHTDAPTVALALTLDCGIWTQDRDFFGCGLPTWTTDTLQGYLNSYA